MTYKYVDPLTQGYKKVKITRKQHKELFENDNLNWATKLEYYIRSDQLLIHKTTNWLGMLLFTLLLPFIVLWQGVANWGEIKHEIKKQYNEKETGSFIQHVCWASKIHYKIFKKLMKEV